MDADTRAALHVIQSLSARLRQDKAMADAAIARCSLAQLRYTPDPGQNPPSVIMKHMAGNLISRFTDYLTRDGEKPWRGRDDEFVDDFPSREAMLARWEEGWRLALGVIDGLQAEDLHRTVTVRGEPHTVVESLHRTATHAAYHVGQIVTLCKLAKLHDGEAWEALTIPVGGSEAYTQAMQAKYRQD